MSESNALNRPLGNNVALPGGDVVDTPQQRATIPGGGPAGGSEGPQNMSFADSRSALEKQHLRNKAAYEASGEALKKLDKIRQGLTHLADKQDVVTMEDIVGEASKLVAHGIDPAALAGVLADAPQEGGGEALGNWVATHAQNAMQAEQQLMQQHSLLRHNMGISAIHLLMAHANGEAVTNGMPQPSTGNSLGTTASPGLGNQPGNQLTGS